MSANTDARLETALRITVALAEAVRDLGTVLTGHLYAVVMGKLSLEAFESLIGVLVRQRIVERTGRGTNFDQLKYVGPEK